MKPALVIPESISAYQTLERFRKKRVHQGLIIDEYGSVKGLITESDIFGAILGENTDDEEDEYYRWQKLPDGSALVDGRMPFGTFLEEMEERLSKEEDDDFTTVAGFVLNQLERVPEAGETFAWRQHQFIVREMDGNRVSKVEVKRRSADPT